MNTKHSHVCITTCGHNLCKLLFTNNIILKKSVVYTLRENVMMIQCPCPSAHFHQLNNVVTMKLWKIYNTY